MIILFGGSSFLGRHLCQLLERRGERALVVARNPDRAFLDRFAPSLCSMDTGEFASSAGQEAIRQARAVVYLAWRSVPATFANEPWREIPENVQPALEFFLRIAGVAPNARIVFLSSGGTIYGCEGEHPKSEASPTNPISSYGLGKLMAEEALRFVGRCYGSPHTILRVSNAIGRWQTNEAQGIVGVALRAARSGASVQLYGGGTQVRDFVDADDVAEAIYAASLDMEHRAATWNIGSGVGVRISDLLERISLLIDRPILTEDAPARALDVPHVVLNSRRAASELGWTARIPIEGSIAELWQRICESE